MRNKSRILWNLITYSVIFITIFSQIVELTYNSETPLLTQKNSTKTIPNAAEVSGNELYAEQIAVTIAGNQSIIQQSYITNDTNCFEKMDMEDPAFYGCSFFMTMSNGIPSPFFPSPVSSSGMSQLSIGSTAFYGFLYYDNLSNYEIIQQRKIRAISILKDTLGMDLILVQPIENITFGYLYPFVGYYPDWSSYFDMILNNLPNDGYWNTFDRARILDSNYVNKKSLSSTLIFVKSLDMLINGFANFNPQDLGISFDFGMLSNLNILGMLFGDTGALFGGADTSSQSDFAGSVGGFIDTFTNVAYVSIQYEGVEASITQLNTTSYKFDLFKALNYKGTQIVGSQKSYNSIVGILITGITVSLYSAEVYSIEPERVKLSEYNIQRLETILFLIGMDFDISLLSKYSFRFGWQSTESLSNLVSIPENLESQSAFTNPATLQDLTNPENLVNLLQLSGFIGLPMLLGALINPLSKFEFKYQLLDQEPYLRITKTADKVSGIVFGEPKMIVEMENVCPFNVYGVPINLSIFGISNDPAVNTLTVNTGLNYKDNTGFTNALAANGYTWDELFPNVLSRFFLIDPEGTGFPTTFYPNILQGGLADIGQLAPYSPEFAAELMRNPEDYSPYVGFLNTVPMVAAFYNNSESIFNPDNWYLKPGEKINITVNYNNTQAMDTFTPFAAMNLSVIPNVTPVISYGAQLSGNASLTYKNDTKEWILTSQNIGETNLIQQYLSFQNTTQIQFGQKSIDAIRFEMNFSYSGLLEDLTLEFFNYSAKPGEEFVPITINSDAISNKTINITISDLTYNISNFYDPAKNYSLLFRLTAESSQAFQLNVDYYQLYFMDRDQNLINNGPATVLYSTPLGVNQYQSASNRLIFGTDDCSSITAFASIDKIHSYSGELNRFDLTIINLGNKPAYNISIEMVQPGILYNLTNPIEIFDNSGSRTKMTAYNFTIDRGTLNISIASLTPGESISHLQFYFYVPNTRIIEGPVITWEDYRDRVVNGSDYRIRANNNFVSAVIRYFNKTNTPFIHQVELEYISDYTYQAKITTGSFITAKMQIRSLNNVTSMYDVYSQIPGNITGFEFMNFSKIIRISEIKQNQNITIEFVFLKKDFRGYFIPLPLSVYGLEQSVTQIIIKKPLNVGRFSLQLNKILETYDDVEGRHFNITVSVENKGNIEIGNFSLNDIWSFDAQGFSLNAGFLVKSIDLLLPNEKVALTYELVVKKQGNYNFTPAEICYYFNYKNMIYSQSYSFKAREPYWKLTARLYLPLVLGLYAIYYTYKKKMSYNKEEMELERRETLLFGQSLRETAWFKKNLIEFLEEEQMKEAKPNNITKSDEINGGK